MMAIARRADASTSATVCLVDLFDSFSFFPFPVLVLPSSFLEFPVSEKCMKKCMSRSPKNDARGPTLELNFSSAIGRIQARVALPLAQTTSGE